MFVTLKELAAEIGVTPRTVSAHCHALEQSGKQVFARIGKPKRVNREEVMRYVYGREWSDDKDGTN